MNAQEVKKLILESTKLTVLYVEDSKEVREQTSELFEMFFEKIDIAVDGQDGLSQYKEFFEKNNANYDLVITDLNMPNMDGVTMSKEILNIHNKQSILVISAHNESERLEELIGINITQYIHKPIMYEHLIIVLERIVSKILNDKKEKKELDSSKKLNFELKHNLKDLAVDFTETIPSPVYVINKNTIVSANKAFKNLLSDKNISENDFFSKNLGEFIFKRKDDYTQDIYDINEGENFDKKFFYQQDNVTKIFIATKTKVKIPTYDEDSFLILLNDTYPLIAKTAMVEYQKNKVQRYYDLVKDMMIKTSFKSKEPVIKNENTKKTTDIEELKILSSKNYIASLDDVIMSDINELIYIKEDLSSAIDEFENNPNKNNVKEITKQLNAYSVIINCLIEFTFLANAISSLANFLSEIDEDILKEKEEIITLNLDSFIDDLESWRKSVFFDKDNTNIHYLDHSLLNSVVQLQIMITSDLEKSDEHGDLEIF